jgi:hypothetical protein
MRKPTYRALPAVLKSTTDPEKRRLIEELLLDEEAKLYDEDHKKK